MDGARAGGAGRPTGGAPGAGAPGPSSVAGAPGPSSGASSGAAPLVLVVCTGNICRSPAAEVLLAAALGPDAGVRVASAGTHAVVGAPVSPPMGALLDAAGVACDGFAARQLTAPLVAEATLVVTMTRRHRTHVVELVPAAVRRTFTLRELARLAAAVDPADLPAAGPAERLRALVPLAAARRGLVPAHPDDDDVPDPYGQGDAAYAASFAALRPAVDVLAGVVLPPGPTPPLPPSSTPLPPSSPPPSPPPPTPPSPPSSPRGR